jgi:serine/threonine protein kinase/WD40 repeat protein
MSDKKNQPNSVPNTLLLSDNALATNAPQERVTLSQEIEHTIAVIETLDVEQLPPQDLAFQETREHSTDILSSDISIQDLSSDETLAPISEVGHSEWITLDADFGNDNAPDIGTITSERYGNSEEIGRGGIGRVLKVVDMALRREVAVKELLVESSDGNTGRSAQSGSRRSGNSPRSAGAPQSREDRLRLRFLREARITGRLEHPNIVPVHELGQRPDGTLYYTMKLVRGRTLREALEACPTAQGLDARLKLIKPVLDLCNAIAYAHSRGVIHRDIKPDNVMLGEFGETIVLDWGLARVIGGTDVQEGDLQKELQSLRRSANLKTVQGLPLGTPAYMSPEQALGELDRVNERSDVWGLGAVLYEVLSGHPPFNEGSPLETVMKAASKPVPPILQVSPQAPPELASICMKALAFSPADRYATARDMASELDAYLSGRRVSAYQYTTWELVRRLINKNRPLSFAVLLILLSLIISTVLISVAYRQTDTARAAAEAAHDAETIQRAAAEAASAAAEAARTAAESARVKAETATAAEATQRAAATAALSQAYADRSEYLLSQHDLLSSRLAAAQAILYSPYHPLGPHKDPLVLSSPEAEAQRRKLSSLYLSSQSHLSHNTTLPLPSPPRRVAISPNNKILAATDETGALYLWDLSTSPPTALPLPFSPEKAALIALESDASSLTFSPDSNLLAFAGPLGRTLFVLDLSKNKILYHLDVTSTFVRDIAFSPNGLMLAAGGAYLHLWNISDGQHLGSTLIDPALGHITSIRWNDENIALFSGHLGPYLVFHLVNQIGTAHPMFQFANSFGIIGIHTTFNEALIHIVTHDSHISTIGRNPHTHTFGIIPDTPDSVTHNDIAEHSFLSVDARWLFISGGLQTHIWSGVDREHIEVIQFPARSSDAALSASQTLFAQAGPGPYIYLWNWNDQPDYGFIGRSNFPLYRLKVSPFKPFILAFDTLGNTIQWSFDKLPASTTQFATQTYDVIFLPSSTLRLAVDPSTQTFALYNEPTSFTEPLSQPIIHLNDANLSTFLRNGLPHSQNNIAAYLTNNGTASILNLSSFKTLSSVPAPSASTIAISPDGQWLVIGSRPALLSVWSLANPERPTLAWSLTPHDSEILRLSFSSDSQFILSASKDGSWQTRLSSNGTLHRHGRHNDRWVTDATFSPDGHYILTAGTDNAAKLWDSNTGNLLHIYPTSEPVLSVAFASDSQHVFFATSTRPYRAPLPFNIWNIDPHTLLEKAQKAIPSQAFLSSDHFIPRISSPPSNPPSQSTSNSLSGRAIAPLNRRAYAPPSLDSITYIPDAPALSPSCTIQPQTSQNLPPIPISNDGQFSLQNFPQQETPTPILVQCPQGDTLHISPWLKAGFSDIELPWLNIYDLRRVLLANGHNLPPDHVIISGRFINQNDALNPSFVTPVGCVSIHSTFPTAYLDSSHVPSAALTQSHPYSGMFYMIVPPNTPIVFNVISGDTLESVSIPPQPPSRVVQIDIPVPLAACPAP